MQGRTGSVKTDRRSIQAFLGWAMLIVVLVSSLALGANRPVSWSFLAMAITGLFSLQLFLDLWKGVPDRAARIAPAAIAFLVVMVWAVIQTLPGVRENLAHPAWDRVPGSAASISADPSMGHQYIMRLLSYAMAFWIMVRASRNRYRARNFLKAIALFSTGLAVYGILALLTGANPILGDATSYNVVSASFVNQNSYATYAVFGVLANVAAYTQISTGYESNRGTRLRRLRNFLESFFSGSWIYALGSLLCIAAVALTQSRAGTGAGIIGLVTFLISYRLKGNRSSLVLLVTVVAMVGFIAFTSTSGLSGRLLATSEENLRFTIYPHVVSSIQDRPILGHGLGAFYDTFRARVPLEAAVGEWDMAHNSYLENIYELGIPAAAALYLALVLVTWRIWRGTIERRRDRAFAAFSFSAILAAGFHAMFDFSLQMPATAALFAVILGLGWAQSFPTSKSKSRRISDGTNKGTSAEYTISMENPLR